MKKYAVLALMGLSLAMPAMAETEKKLETFSDRLSYSMGYEVASYFINISNGDVKEELLVQGIKDAYAKAKPALTPEEMIAVRQEFDQKRQAQQVAQLEELKAKNKVAGAAYLEENKAKENVIVTNTGLQYEVLVEGSGATPTAADTVKVEYVGTLVDGTEFDSTAKHGEPAEFTVGQVIPGWSEALQMMKEGSKLRLVIPAELAYGEQGAAPLIEPNSTLIFEVELLEVVR